MLALSIRQPFAELILRGIKRVEYRSRATRQVGRRFWIYASKKYAVGSGRYAAGDAGGGRRIWAADLAGPGAITGGAPLPQWMIELAEQVRMIEPELLGGAVLPVGVIVGSAVIERCQEIKAAERPADKDVRPAAPLFAWHLADVEPVTRPRKPARRPQPVWFRPF